MAVTLSYFNAPATPVDAQSCLNIIVNTINAGNFQITTQLINALGAGTQTATSGTVLFANSNGISFGMSGSNQITASYTVPSIPSQTNQTIGMSTAGNTAGTAGTVNGQLIFAGGNNITLSQSVNGQSATISIVGVATAAQSTQTIGLYALGNTTQNSSTTFNATGISFSAGGAQTVGFNAGAVQISSPSATPTTLAAICTATQTYTNNATPAAIPGMSITVSSGKTYIIRVHVMSTSGAGGVTVALGGTATLTSCLGTGVYFSTTGTMLNTTSQFSGAGTIAAASAVNASDAYIDMTIVVNNGGTIVIQGCQNSSNGSSSTILQNSNMTAIMQ